MDREPHPRLPKESATLPLLFKAPPKKVSGNCSLQSAPEAGKLKGVPREGQALWSEMRPPETQKGSLELFWCGLEDGVWL